MGRSKDKAGTTEVPGPLSAFVGLYESKLAELGYAPLTRVHLRRQVVHVAPPAWLRPPKGWPGPGARNAARPGRSTARGAGLWPNFPASGRDWPGRSRKTARPNWPRPGAGCRSPNKTAKTCATGPGVGPGHRQDKQRWPRAEGPSTTNGHRRPWRPNRSARGPGTRRGGR
jgi:hypothetical protein